MRLLSAAAVGAVLAVPGAAAQNAADEAPTLWNALMFNVRAWHPGGPFAFGGVALWMAILVLVALWRFRSPLAKVAMLTGVSTAATFVWWLIPNLGPSIDPFLLLLAGFAVGWLAVRGVAALSDAVRAALVPSALGAFAGTLLAYAVREAMGDRYVLVLGGGRFVDPVFVVPGGALLAVTLLKLLPDVVHAFEDANELDAAAAPAAGPGQGDTFQVTCLRCRTEIKVDRSMKRFRVATDRFEFACPNCQYWMEWADPGQPSGAAAA